MNLFNKKALCLMALMSTMYIVSMENGNQRAQLDNACFWQTLHINQLTHINTEFRELAETNISDKTIKIPAPVNLYIPSMYTNATNAELLAKLHTRQQHIIRDLESENTKLRIFLGKAFLKQIERIEADAAQIHATAPALTQTVIARSASNLVSDTSTNHSPVSQRPLCSPLCSPIKPCEQAHITFVQPSTQEQDYSATTSVGGSKNSSNETMFPVQQELTPMQSYVATGTHNSPVVSPILSPAQTDSSSSQNSLHSEPSFIQPGQTTLVEASANHSQGSLQSQLSFQPEQGNASMVEEQIPTTPAQTSQATYINHEAHESASPVVITNDFDNESQYPRISPVNGLRRMGASDYTTSSDAYEPISPIKEGRGLRRMQSEDHVQRQNADNESVSFAQTSFGQGQAQLSFVQSVGVNQEEPVTPIKQLVKRFSVLKPEERNTPVDAAALHTQLSFDETVQDNSVIEKSVQNTVIAQNTSVQAQPVRITTHAPAVRIIAPQAVRVVVPQAAPIAKNQQAQAFNGVRKHGLRNNELVDFPLRPAPKNTYAPINK